MNKRPLILLLLLLLATCIALIYDTYVVFTRAPTDPFHMNLSAGVYFGGLAVIGIIEITVYLLKELRSAFKNG